MSARERSLAEREALLQEERNSLFVDAQALDEEKSHLQRIRNELERELREVRLQKILSGTAGPATFSFQPTSDYEPASSSASQRQLLF